MRSRRLYLTFFCFHALFILAVASRDALWLIARGATILPASAHPVSRAGESLLGSMIEGNFVTRGYLHLAGIESGYSYFAPNVGDSYKLVFELRYPDGRTEYDSFVPENREGDLRLEGLLNQIAKTRSDAMREVVIKLLTQAAWQRYPEVEHVRAVLGALKLPGPNEYKKGQRASYEFLYAYDFSLSDDAR